MRRVSTVGGALTGASALATIWLVFGPRPTPASPPPVGPTNAPVAAGPKFVPRGAGSCAAAACHGSATSLPSFSNVFRNEHTTWITRDPHSRAYEVLSDERSLSIARNLGNGRPGGRVIAPSEDARCLACHSTPSATTAALGDAADVIRRDGVGCESCHGPSSGWLSEHTRADFVGLSGEVKHDQFGLNNLKNPIVRAKTCTGCHVGAPEGDGLPLRDVNHDLIAAGHPRLDWEFSAYVANYPKHWTTANDPPDWDARLWKIGQVETLRAATDLLNARAEAAEAHKAPWPEFAEYSCYSCHFALKDKPFKVGLDPQTPPGMPAWGSWTTPLIPPLAKLSAGPAPSADERLNDLRTVMKTFGAEPKIAAEKARSTRDALSAWLATLPNAPLTAPEIKTLIAALDARDAAGRLALVHRWDSAAQVYLGLAALNVSLQKLDPNAVDPKLRAELKELLGKLSFAKGFDSPRDFNPSAPNR